MYLPQKKVDASSPILKVNYCFSILSRYRLIFSSLQSSTLTTRASTLIEL